MAPESSSHFRMVIKKRAQPLSVGNKTVPQVLKQMRAYLVWLELTQPASPIFVQRMRPTRIRTIEF